MLDAAIASDSIDESGMAGLVSMSGHSIGGTTLEPADLDDAIEAARAALLGRQEDRRPLGVRAGGGCDDPRRIRAAVPLPRPCRPGARGGDRDLSPRPAECKPGRGRSWRLAAVPQRRVQRFGVGQSLLRAENDRRRSGRAAHGPGAATAILAAGGAERSNVFTRIQLALFGEVPWRAVPAMPLEIMLLPQWFPFNLDRVSYWSRTVLVPLLVLMHRQPRARNPRGDPHRRTVRDAAGADPGLDPRAVPLAVGCVVQAGRRGRSRRPSAVSEAGPVPGPRRQRLRS